jgi:hypothetical protein
LCYRSKNAADADAPDYVGATALRNFGKFVRSADARHPHRNADIPHFSTTLLLNASERQE